MNFYDENMAVAAINTALLTSGRKSYPEDEILNVIDMIWDYYEENGLLDLDDDDLDDDDSDIAEELADYVARMLKKDKEAQISLDDVRIIVDAELDYENSIIED